MTEHRQDPRPDDIGKGHRREAHSVEKRRRFDVGRIRLPAKHLALGNLESLPALVAVEGAGILVAEHLGVDRLRHRLADLLGSRPDVLQEHRSAIAAGSDRAHREIRVNRAGQRVGDHQGRRGQVVEAHDGIDASLEIAVAAEHRGRHQVVLLDRGGQCFGHRTAVADTGGASVTHQVKAQLLQVGRQTGAVEVAGDDL